MGLFDAIKGILNPEIISTYEEIINSHSEAFRRWKGRQIVGTFSSTYNFSPSYNDKYYIATHKSEILRVEQEIAEEKAFEKRKQEVINAASKYPHAFYALVKRLGLSSIPGITVTLPGERKSKYAKKQAEQAQQQKTNPNKSVKSVLDYIDIDSINRLGSFINTSSPYSGKKVERSIKTLDKEEYEKLYLHLYELADEERKIEVSLKKEDTVIKFEDEVLCDKKRLTYYKKFVDSKLVTTNVEEYCVAHLSQLDDFINDIIHSEYKRITMEYPLGAKYFEDGHRYSKIPKEENVVNNEMRIISLDDACKKYDELKKKYPIGVPALEKYYSYDDGKNSADLSIEEVVEREEEIKIFQIYAREAAFYANWEQTQIDFNSKCRKLRDSVLSGWGCYKYNIPFSKVKENGEEVKGELTVWQMFYNSFSEDESVDTSYYPKMGENRKLASQLLNNEVRYKSHIYDKIVNYIEELRKIYKNEDEIYIKFACTGLENRKEVIEYQFKYLKTELDKRGIKHSLVQKSPIFIEDQVRYVVIDLVTTNEQLRENVSMLLDAKRYCRKYCSKEIRFNCFSDIVYITVLKGYDKQEMIALNKAKEHEIKMKAEEKRKQEEEEIRKEKERQQEEQRKQNEILSLRSCVSSWDTLFLTLPYNYLLPYYPTSCDFEANNEEWNDRWLVWNFKNTPGKTNLLQHEQALSNLIPRLTRLLQDTFGLDLPKLTLVCIPAASRINNDARYRDFSERLVRITGMENAFGHIQIVKDAVPKHLGGTGIPVLQFDESFFKDKYVILFDDIITKGNSMLRFKNKLESCGATVIAGVSIGKTHHER